MSVSKFFTTFGFICIALAVVLFWQRNNPSRIAFKSVQVNNKEEVIKKILPIRLIIESSKIDLPIIPAKVYDQKWEVSSNGVSWLDMSPIPGQKGNSVLYGHNWTNLLGNLRSVRPGDNITIVFADSSQKSFIVETTATVLPNNVSVLSQTKDETITIYTCIGLFDEKRFVVVAKLSE